MADPKIDPAWVKGIRAWVKKTFAPKTYRTPEEAQAHVQRLLRIEFPRLEEYLLLKNGMLPRSGNDPKLKSILDKMRDKVSEELAAAREQIDEGGGKIRFYIDALTPGTNEYEYRDDMRKFYEGKEDAYLKAVSEFADEAISKAEAILSGKLLRFLSTWLAKYSDGVAFEPDGILTEYAIGKMKFVWDANTFPKSQRRDPYTLKDYIPHLAKAQALLERKGLGSVWYGTTLISCKSCGGENPHGADLGVGGHYRWDIDRVVLFDDPSRYITELMVHELGHRYYYRKMNQGDRARFSSYFGEVMATSSYGAKASEEDFAEVFQDFVLGKDMTRDQIERFKEFLAGEDRKRLAAQQDPIVKSVQVVLERHGHGGSYAEDVAYEVQNQLAGRMASRVAARAIDNYFLGLVGSE